MATTTAARTLERAVSRPLALAVLGLVPGIPAVVLFSVFGQNLTADYIAVAVGVPLITFYLLARICALLVKAPSEDERAEMTRVMNSKPAILVKLVTLQALLLILATIIAASAPTYGYLGLTETWVVALKVGGSLFGVAAFLSITTGLLILAAESHATGGFIRRCHMMCLLVVYLMSDVVSDVRSIFDHATLTPAHFR